MRSRVRAVSICSWVLAGIALPAIARAAPLASENDEESLLELGSQLEKAVVSSTKAPQRAVEAPAAVTVITGDELRARGYTSLAQALRWVPGFYDVNDLVTHNVGVRGINGGVGAAGNGLKVMIDGQPVDYRPTNGNFFGPELVPIEAIDRVEIIRGPSSALYGADAFLGVVNVITRSGRDVNGLALVAHGALVRQNPGGGGELVLGGAAGDVDALVAGSFFELDRSGLSPSQQSIAEIPRLASAGPSENDVARPKSLLAKLALGHVAGGTVTLLATIQELDSGAEFQEYEPLTHDSRVALVNQDYRLRWEAKASDAVSFAADAYWLDSRPGPQESLDLGQPGVLAIPSVATWGFGADAESRQLLGDSWRLTEGVDYTREQNLLQSFGQLYTAGTPQFPPGTLVPGPGAGDQITFVNFGAYAQAVYAFGSSWSATAGARVDDHTLYGVNPSARAGLVYAPPGSAWSAKLLYGSSFQAPSPVQLFTQPMTQLTLTGNPSLSTQDAHTVELVGGVVLPNGRGEITADVFGTDVLNRVEFLQRGLFLTAQNIPGELVVGGELDARFALARPVQLRVLAGVAQTVAEDLGPAFQGLPQVVEPLFPPWQLHAILDWQLPWAALRVSPELSFIGPRASSESNAVAFGTPYELPPYLYTGGSISSTALHPFGRPMRIALHVDNALNQIWYDPGFNGLDVPAPGRTVMLTVAQSL